MRSVGRRLPSVPRSATKKKILTVKCRGCGHDLAKGSPQVVCVQVGTVTVDDGNVDFDQRNEWGYMHLRCFQLAVGDPAVFAA